MKKPAELLSEKQWKIFEPLFPEPKRRKEGRGRPRSHIKRIIADRGYDSDTLRMRFHKRGTDLIVPYRKNIRNRRFEDKRKLRRFRKRWKIERTNAWLQNFRRIQVRYDRILTVFQSIFSLRLLDYRLAAFMQPVLARMPQRHWAGFAEPIGCGNRVAQVPLERPIEEPEIRTL